MKKTHQQGESEQYDNVLKDNWHRASNQKKSIRLK